MEATKRCKSSTAEFFFDAHFDGSTAADSRGDAAPTVEGVVGVRDEGIVVEKFENPPPEASVGVDEGVEGVEDAVFVDEGVVDAFFRLGSILSAARWG